MSSLANWLEYCKVHLVQGTALDYWENGVSSLSMKYGVGGIVREALVSKRSTSMLSIGTLTVKKTSSSYTAVNISSGHPSSLLLHRPSYTPANLRLWSQRPAYASLH